MTTPFPFTSGQVLTAAQMNAITTLPINDQTASYTLVVGDVGKRVIMNVASANTVTVNDSIFAAGDTIFIANKGAGVSTITAGAGVTINTSGSLALAQYGGGTLVALSASTFTFFPAGGIGYGVATGGTSSSITVGGVAYTMLTFTADGNLVVSKSGLFDCLLVGGGGGGGARNVTSYTGGGGGGGLTVQTIYLDADTYALDVGAGGAIDTAGASSRLAAALTSLTAVGGGNGGGNAPTATGNRNNQQGGCGGGGGNENQRLAGIGMQGFNGGVGSDTPGTGAGGGGGGGAVGGNRPTEGGTAGGDGGAGFDASTFRGETAATTLYAGGGGGGGASGGTGGSGGGGGRATAGTANTGGGGGGNSATGSNNAGAGGSGIVLVRFKS